MNSLEEAAAVAQAVRETNGACRLEGVFTHHASADESDQVIAEAQADRFVQLREPLLADDIASPTRRIHSSNSAAFVRREKDHSELVRIGIALYGLHPNRDETHVPTGVRPALRWFANIVQRRVVPQAGTGVSYG